PGLALIPLEAWLGVAYLGLFSSGLCFLMWYNSINLIGASRTGIFINIVPIAALFSSWLILGEQLTPVHLLGAALVVIGVTVTNYPRGGDSAGEKRGRPLSRPLAILVGDHRVGQPAELLDLDGDRIPLLQEDGRFAGKAHP
ncbi:MAG: DMT family transporter, partial [Limnochordia bacterium]